MAMTKREESKMKRGPVAKTTGSRPRNGGRERERERELKRGVRDGAIERRRERRAEELMKERNFCFCL